ncbi:MULTISPECIES: hypothetical protein [Branchiibius]|nr:hypothetical protein [Branchiibius hedensis]
MTKNQGPELQFLDNHQATSGGMMLATWGDYGYEPEHELLAMQVRGQHVGDWTEDAVFAAKRG